MAAGFADKLIALGFERTYRNIFGSQIEALAQANVGGGMPEDELRKLFGRYKAALPDIHGKRAFESWLGFLLNEGYIDVHSAGDGTRFVSATPAGVEFLQYILKQGLPYQKFG